MKLLFHLALSAYFMQVAHSNICGEYPDQPFNRNLIVGNWTAVYTSDSNKKCQFLDISRYFPSNQPDYIRGLTTRIWTSFRCNDTNCGEGIIGGIKQGEMRDEVYDCDAGLLTVLLQNLFCNSCVDKKACFWGGQSRNVTLGKKENPCAGGFEFSLLPLKLENVEVTGTNYCDYMIVEYRYGLLADTKIEIYVRNLSNSTAATTALEIAKRKYSNITFYNSDDGSCTYCYRSVPIP